MNITTIIYVCWFWRPSDRFCWCSLVEQTITTASGCDSLLMLTASKKLTVKEVLFWHEWPFNKGNETLLLTRSCFKWNSFYSLRSCFEAPAHMQFHYKARCQYSVITEWNKCIKELVAVQHIEVTGMFFRGHNVLNNDYVGYNIATVDVFDTHFFLRFHSGSSCPV